MKKILQLIVASLIVSATTISLPLLADPPLLQLAETAITTVPNSKEAPNEASSEDSLRFTLQHRIANGNPIPQETIAIPFDKITTRPVVVLETLKQSFIKLLEKQTKPVQIDTTIDFLLPAGVTQKIGKLPVLSIKTNVNSDGTGKSDLLIAAEKREIKDGNHKASLDWKGLNGLLCINIHY